MHFSVRDFRDKKHFTDYLESVVKLVEKGPADFYKLCKENRMPYNKYVKAWAALQTFARIISGFNKDERTLFINICCNINGAYTEDNVQRMMQTIGLVMHWGDDYWRVFIRINREVEHPLSVFCQNTYNGSQQFYNNMQKDFPKLHRAFIETSHLCERLGLLLRNPH